MVQFGRRGGGSGVDQPARDRIAAMEATTGDVVVDYSTGAAGGLRVVKATDTQSGYVNTTGADITLSGGTAAELVANGLVPADELQIDEVILSATPLVGAVPAGAKHGLDYITGINYYDLAGVWAEVPGERHIVHYTPTARLNDTQGVEPTVAETNANPTDGSTARIVLSDGTAENWTFATTWGLSSTEAATPPIDEDDMASNLDTVAPSQQSVKAYVDRREPMLEIFGWVKTGGQIVEAGARRVDVNAVTLMRWDSPNDNVQSFSHAAKSPATFQYYDRNGVVATGFDGSDVSTSQTAVNTAVGYDNGGTLASITGQSADTNDGVNYRYYMIPQTGEIAVLLPQVVQTTVSNAFYRLEDETNQLVLPAALTGAVLLGVATLDENAGNFTFSMSSGPLGTLAGQSQGVEDSFRYVATPALRDALTPAEMTEGGHVAVGSGDDYEEWRILTIGTDWVSTTKVQTYPAEKLATLEFGTTDIDWMALNVPENEPRVFYNRSPLVRRNITWDDTLYTATIQVIGSELSLGPTNGVYSIPTLSAITVERQGTVLRMLVQG